MKRGTFILGLVVMATMSFAQPQANYYPAATLDGKNGRNLEVALQSIVYPHTKIKYDKLWKAYQTTDLAPTDSIPASYTGNYSMLVYDMYAWMQFFPKFYEEETVNKEAAHSQTGGINREHCVPNSWWGGEEGNDTAYTDLHHLYPADGAANNVKQNYPLGEYISGLTLAWPTQTQSSNGKVYATAENACSHVWNVNGTAPYGALKVFEPADMYKGDFARAYLYVVCAYEKKVTWQTTENTMFSNNATTNYTDIAPWAINLLLKWHRNDPVSEKEKVRNNAVESLQHNRNPFIDYPELVEYIWGNKSSESFVLANANCSYSSVYYEVSAAPSIIGGSVAASPAAALAGDKVTLVATPNETHLFRNLAANWSVQDENDQPVAITVGEGNTCTFTMPASRVTVSATFEDDPDAYHYLFREDFSSIDVGNNTDVNHSGSAWTINDNFTASSNVYKAGGAIRLGKGDAPGSITTKTLDLSANGGRFILAFDVKGWTTVEGKITVTVTGQTTQTFTYSTVMASDEFQTIQHLYEGGTSGTTITIATTAKRAFIDNIRVYYYRDMCSFSVGSTGWGTFYTDQSFVMPASTTGYTATYTDPDLTLSPDYNAGDTVPAYTPLLIEAPQGTHNYFLAQSQAASPATVLYGNMYEGTTPTILDATHYYKLANGEQGLGWYWGAEDHGVFHLAAGKAYLALNVAAASAPAHIALPNHSPTRLTTSATTDIDWTQQAFNVMGQPVKKGAKGVIIQNGTKYVVVY